MAALVGNQPPSLAPLAGGDVALTGNGASPSIWQALCNGRIGLVGNWFAATRDVSALTVAPVSPTITTYPERP